MQKIHARADTLYNTGARNLKLGVPIIAIGL